MTRLDRKRAPAGTGMGTELQRLIRLTAAFASRELDRTFEMTSAGAARRRVQALFCGVLFFVTAFGLQALLRWRAGAILVPAADLGALAPEALLFGWRILLVLGIASSLAMHFSGRFVADIFELKDPRVAWAFIGRLATGGQAAVLHLREGRLAENDRKSPIVQIGGPGRVLVEYDTAALFEKADGVPHVVGASDGATKSGASGQAVVELEGFERLREPLISLRDQYIGNPSVQPLTVVGRSLDGLPISVTDVRGVFSVRRDGRTGSASTPVERPFPFRAQDIENSDLQATCCCPDVRRARLGGTWGVDRGDAHADPRLTA